VAFAYDGIFIGATWTAAMRNLMLISLACSWRPSTRAAQRQRRPVVGDADVHGGARRGPGPGLPAAGAAGVCMIALWTTATGFQSPAAAKGGARQARPAIIRASRPVPARLQAFR
jgi:hypothetical protein